MARKRAETESADGGARRAPSRPAFVRAYPRDPSLDLLVKAFHEGDFATVRREALDLARRTEDEAVREAARDLRARIEPDPIVRAVLALAALVVLVVGGYWVLAGHAPHGR